MKYQVGQSASFRKTITEYDVYGFAGITGDFNPVHIDKVAAEQSMFKQRIAHGILGVGLISAVLGNQLPGNGTIYLGQNVMFKKPVLIGDTITATVEVKEITEKGKMILRTYCTNQDGDVVIDGEATVLPPK